MDQLKLLQTIPDHGERVWCVRWNFDGSLMASSGSDKTIRVWKRDSQEKAAFSLKLLCSLTEMHTKSVRCVNWSPCGNFFASVGFDAMVLIWQKRVDEATGATTFEVCTDISQTHRSEVKSVAFSPSGQFIATCSRDKLICVWEFDEEGDVNCSATLEHHTQDVKCVIWHPLDDILVSCSYDNSICFFKEDCGGDDEWFCFNSIDSAHSSSVLSLCFDASGSVLFSSSQDCTIKLWRQPATSSEKSSVTTSRFVNIATISGHQNLEIFQISWNADWNLLASCSADNSICVFRIPEAYLSGGDIAAIAAGSSTGDEHALIQKICQLENAHESDVNSVDWRPNFVVSSNLSLQPSVASKQLILSSGGDDGTIKLWNLHTADLTDCDLPLD